MKRFLLGALLVSLLLVSPVSADAPYKLIVNDKPIDKPVVMIDGSAYVPLRLVADTFNATTDWNMQTKTITVKAKQVDPKAIKRPEIKGDAEFVQKVTAALDLLEQKDFPDYWMVCQNTSGIVFVAQKTDSAKDTWNAAFRSDGVTAIFPLLTNDSKRYDPVYLAGVLTHEASHATDYLYGKPISEKEGYSHELAAFKTLDAPQWMQDECLTMLKQQ